MILHPQNESFLMKWKLYNILNEQRYNSTLSKGLKYICVHFTYSLIYIEAFFLLSQNVPFIAILKLLQRKTYDLVTMTLYLVLCTTVLNFKRVLIRESQKKNNFVLQNITKNYSVNNETKKKWSYKVYKSVFRHEFLQDSVRYSLRTRDQHWYMYKNTYIRTKAGIKIVFVVFIFYNSIIIG